MPTTVIARPIAGALRGVRTLPRRPVSACSGSCRAAVRAGSTAASTPVIEPEQRDRAELERADVERARSSASVPVAEERHGDRRDRDPGEHPVVARRLRRTEHERRRPSTTRRRWTLLAAGGGAQSQRAGLPARADGERRARQQHDLERASTRSPSASSTMITTAESGPGLLLSPCST